MPTFSAAILDPKQSLSSSKTIQEVEDASPRVSTEPWTSHFFEGAEKRLAIYLSKDPNNLSSCAQPTLRTIPRSTWKSVLDLVNCQILSVTSNAHLDAYLLSESSMFVWDDRVMIKTCGTTTLLHCLKQMLMLGLEQGGFDRVDSVFYSHKELLLPEAQMHPHQCFSKEVAFLNKTFQRNGLALHFGSNATNSSPDRFYMYTLNDLISSYSLPSLASFDGSSSGSPTTSNEHFKFEIIMEQLDPGVMSHFLYNNNEDDDSKLSAEEVTERSGIAGLIPGMVIDDYLFDPCGYSMNGLFGKHYMTIHITPEPDFSYVSLEIDVPLRDYPEFVRKVTDTFKPGKFMLNLMLPSGGREYDDMKLCMFEARFDGFQRVEGKLTEEVNPGADLIYARFVCDD